MEGRTSPVRQPWHRETFSYSGQADPLPFLVLPKLGSVQAGRLKKRGRSPAFLQTKESRRTCHRLWNLEWLFAAWELVAEAAKLRRGRNRTLQASLTVDSL